MEKGKQSEELYKYIFWYVVDKFVFHFTVLLHVMGLY